MRSFTKSVSLADFTHGAEAPEMIGIVAFTAVVMVVRALDKTLVFLNFSHS